MWVPWSAGIDECVLRPVAQHERQGRQRVWQQQRVGCSDRSMAGCSQDKQPIHRHAGSCTRCLGTPAGAQRIQGQLKAAQQGKARPVAARVVVGSSADRADSRGQWVLLLLHMCCYMCVLQCVL